MRFFKCKHKAIDLVVEKEQEIVKKDEDFEIVTYFFFCTNCREYVELKHAKTINGVDHFLEGGV